MSEGLGAGVSVGVGAAVGVAALGNAAGVEVAVPRLWVVATADRMTVPNPPSVVGVAIGARSAEGLGLIAGLGVTSAATEEA